MYEDEATDMLNKEKFTCYQVVDPAGARNYVALWAGVNDMG